MVVVTVGLEDISAQFLPRRRDWNWYQRPWAVVKQGRLMRSQTDYIMGSDRQIFHNVAVQDSQHNSGPLHGPGVSAFRLPEVSVILPWVQDMPPSLSAQISDEDIGKQYFRRV